VDLFIHLYVHFILLSHANYSPSYFNEKVLHANKFMILTVETLTNILKSVREKVLVIKQAYLPTSALWGIRCQYLYKPVHTMSSISIARNRSIYLNMCFVEEIEWFEHVVLVSVEFLNRCSLEVWCWPWYCVSWLESLTWYQWRIQDLLKVEADWTRHRPYWGLPPPPPVWNGAGCRPPRNPPLPGM